MTSAIPVPSVESLERGYSEHGEIRGFRSGCGFATGTWGLVCPQCGARDLKPLVLSSTGVIVAFTVQTVPGDEFLSEAPYAYVVVELDGGGRVTGWIPARSSESPLAVGQRVRLAPPSRSGLQFAAEPNERNAESA